MMVFFTHLQKSFFLHKNDGQMAFERFKEDPSDPLKNPTKEIYLEKGEYKDIG